MAKKDGCPPGQVNIGEECADMVYNSFEVDGRNISVLDKKGNLIKSYQTQRVVDEFLDSEGWRQDE